MNILDKTVREVMSRPLSPDELKGFVRKGDGPPVHPTVKPFVDVSLVTRRGKRGIKVTAGVKGTF